MANFRFAVSGQQLELLTPTKGIADTINANTAYFDFRTEDWSDVTKWAHFYNPKYNDGAPYNFQLVNDEIPATAGLNLQVGVWEVYLHGDKTVGGTVTKRLITETQTIRVVESNPIGTT
jgi:hypothetical protein